jgi:D-alanyl-D-alanine carboxypeptidase
MQKPMSVPDILAIFANHVGIKIAIIFITSFVAILTAAPSMAKYSSLIMDATSGRVLHETNADLTRYPASLTKMMTLYLLFEALDNGTVAFDESLPISEHAASQPPSKLGLMPGQSISVENAILALVTKSANDVAAAVAERLGGRESRFAWLMTSKAGEIGMSRTMFANASGLPDPDQVTTARDVAVLALALLHDFPHYYHYFSTDHFYYDGAMHANHNRLLGSYGGLDGIKTGYTHSSGFNLVASAVRDGRRLIGVVLGARSPANRSFIMVNLLDQAFGGHEIIEVQDEEPAPPVQVRLASVTPRKVKVAAIAPKALARARLRLPAKVTRNARASPSRASIKTASARAPVLVVGSKKALSRFPVTTANVNLARTPQAVKTRARSEQRLAAARPGAKAQKQFPAKSIAAAKSPPQLKTGRVSAKPNAARVAKASSTPDRSKLRVAEGERRRSS